MLTTDKYLITQLINIKSQFLKILLIPVDQPVKGNKLYNLIIHLIVQNSLRGSSTAFFVKFSTKLVIEKNYKSRDYKEKDF